MSDNLPPDIAALFPPDHELWYHVPALSVRDAVLLSLGIEPRVNDYVPLDIDDDGNEVPSVYGRQHNEYIRRIAVLTQAVHTGFVTRGSDGLIPKAEFVFWAKELGWELPTVLTEAPSSAMALREAVRREETDTKVQALTEKALEFLKAHPQWKKSEIARRVCRHFDDNPHEDFGSPPFSTIRNILFNNEAAPLKGPLLEAQRVIARENYRN
ncbi:MAG: hypothetical protein P4L87_21165 [Formivibrio sp.]|nr:hypothetical protein [Formivibrio sp.]